MSDKLDPLLDEFEHAVISENDRGWSGARSRRARAAIRELFDEKDAEMIERDIHREMERDGD